MNKIKKEDALNYHSQGQAGKIEVVPTKMLSTQYDLAQLKSDEIKPGQKLVIS